MISRVLYVPNLCKNLLSVIQIMKHRMTILFEDGVMEVRSRDTGDLITQGTEKAGLHQLCALMVHEGAGHSNNPV